MNIASKIIEKPSLTRRDFVAGMATATIAFGSLPAFGAEKLKVVGIYTQPIQQKWDARLHLALERRVAVIGRCHGFDQWKFMDDAVAIEHALEFFQLFDQR